MVCERLRGSEGRVWERLVHPVHLFSLGHHFNQLGGVGSANVEKHPGSYLDCVIWESCKKLSDLSDLSSLTCDVGIKQNLVLSSSSPGPSTQMGWWVRVPSESSQPWLITPDKGRLLSRGWLTSHHLLGPRMVFHNSNGRSDNINHTFIDYKAPSVIH